MKVLLCLYFSTIVSSVRVPIIGKEYGSSPSISGRRDSTFNLPELSRTSNPLQFYSKKNNEKSVYIPKTSSKKYTLKPIRDEKFLIKNTKQSNDNWIPIVPTVQFNGKNYQQKSQLPVNLPTKTVPILTKVKGKYQPTFRTIQQQIVSLPKHQSQSYYPQNNIGQNTLNLLPSQIDPQSIIRPQVVYNPFPTNLHQTTPQSFGRNQPESSFNTFADVLSQKIISPIFTPLNKYENPEKERETFFRNFNINQFLEQQKAFNSDQTPHVPEPISPDKFTNYFTDFETSKSNYNPDNHKRDYSVLGKNYRDDRLHELPTEPSSENVRDEVELTSNETEKDSQQNNATPQDVPTKPIYPGEGQWAKPGIKHRVYMRKNPYETNEETSEKPDGYETFLKGEEFFNGKRDKFQSQINQFPSNHKLGNFLRNDQAAQTAETTDRRENEDSTNDEDEEEEFVPTKLYAQVRHSEDEEHLPAEEGDEGRLKEVIKDSKIQTVYTEEGYEDVGYDHGGHEKLAESDEGFDEKERQLQKSEEKKIPKKKVINQFNEYSKGDELISDEEIEADKSSLTDEDSFSAGSEYQESPNDNAKNSAKEKRKGKKKNKRKEIGKNKHNKKDFISTKETKTMTAKDNDDGNIEMEITGEVKVVMQPNNSSKSQRFVKKLPTIHKVVEPEFEEEYELARVEEVTSEVPKKRQSITDTHVEELPIEKDHGEIISTTSQPQEIDPLEIPITTRPTTAIPRSSVLPLGSPNDLTEIDVSFSKIRSKVRRKRFTNDFPDINIDTEFISKIKHDLDPPKKDPTLVKYPYYENFKDIGVNENSPLRYAEDMKNIPRKEEGKMTFYEQAESRVSCPEIASTIEPIPERVLNAEQNAADKEEEYSENEGDNETDYDEEAQESQNQEVHEQPNRQRLSGLGDKIDCLKARYFGEDPLDSPFFNEDTVGPVIPIFDHLTMKNDQSKNDLGSSEKLLRVSDDTLDVQSAKSEKLSDPVARDNSSNNGQHNQSEVERPLNKTNETPTVTSVDISQNLKNSPEESTEISLITTPSYEIDMKPNNIYDQIRLLDYLPDESNNTLNGHAESPKTEKLVSWGSNLLDSVRIPKYHLADTSEHGSIDRYRRRRIRLKPKVTKYQTINRQKYIPLSSFKMSTGLFPSITTTTASSPTSFSEVFYKNEIKPNEQMNVFTDILNNIKTSSENEIETTNEKQSINSNEHYQVDSTPPSHPTILPKKFAPGSYGHNPYLQAFDKKAVRTEFYSPSTTTNEPPKVTQPTISYEVTEPLISSVPDAKIKNLNSKKQFVIFLTSTRKFLPKVEQTTQKPHLGVIPSKLNASVLKGMVQPRPHHLINPFKRDNTVFENNQEADAADKIVNKFLFIGLKPPPMQKVNSYNDFNHKFPPRKRKPTKRRNKRSPNRSYSSLSRRRGPEVATEKPITTTEVGDDYVPHRPKNYYYDEKLGKIVYLKQNDKEEEEEEEQEVPVEDYYEEVTEKAKIAKITTPKQNPIFATATPPPQGQSYIDFVKKLKSASEYREIPDPVSTEESQLSTTTLKPMSTTPPEFLSLLAKLHSDKSYKLIEDPKEKKSSPKSTTELPIESIEEEEEQEEFQEEKHVQNSRGGDISQIGENFKIFDINEYIPKIKNYLPKTSIDTSKYKTIERPTHITPPEEENFKTATKETNISETHSTTSAYVEHFRMNPLTSENTAPETTIVTTSTTVQNDTPKRKIQILRNRGRRPARTTVTTQSPSLTTEPYQRTTRRTSRLRSRTTTAKYLDEIEDSSTKVLRRRSDKGDGEESARNLLFKNVPEILNSNVGKERRFLKRTNATKSNNDVSHSNVSSQDSNAGNSKIPKDVKVFKKYNLSQKHGGNYRRIDHENSSKAKESLVENVTKPSERIEHVEIISEFDKSKKHGGNYRTETDEKESTDEDNYKSEKNSNVEMNSEGKLENNKHHLDENYNISPEQKRQLGKTEAEPLKLNLWEETYSDLDRTTTTKPQLPPSKPKRFKGKNQKKNNNYDKSASRLTDIVPKPEMFFTDPNLPLAVNMLTDGTNTPTEEIAKFITEDENNKEVIIKLSGSENDEKFNDNDDSVVYTPEVKTAFIGEQSKNRLNGHKLKQNVRNISTNSRSVVVSTTNKPVIIKDPNKRLYFSAPV